MESSILPFYLHIFFCVKFNKMKKIVGQIRGENIRLCGNNKFLMPCPSQGTSERCSCKWGSEQVAHQHTTPPMTWKTLTARSLCGQARTIAALNAALPKARAHMRVNMCFCNMLLYWHIFCLRCEPLVFEYNVFQFWYCHPCWMIMFFYVL